MINSTLERSSSKKFRCASYFFNSLLSVSPGDGTLRLMLDILHQKEKSLRWAINSCFSLSKTGVAVHRTSRESSREFAATSIIRIIVWICPIGNSVIQQVEFLSPKRFSKFSSRLGYYSGLFISVYNLFGAEIYRSEILPRTPEGWIS